MGNIKKELIDLDLIHENNIIKYFASTRDREDIKVFKDLKSNIIFLESSEHLQEDYYAQQENTAYWGAENRGLALKNTYEDDRRKYQLIENLVINKSYLDIGTGLGGVLDLVKPIAKSIHAIEPQTYIREYLNENFHYNVYENLNKIPINFSYDIISLFHVFEHLINPLDDLKKIHEKLNPHGKIVVEVPHAEDFLIKFLELESFKKFTFWSQHLILHTRESLFCYLHNAGFNNISIKGVQRYNLANHLFWLKHNLPGGHHKWGYLMNEALEQSYENMLTSINATDTLIAIAEK